MSAANVLATPDELIGRIFNSLVNSMELFTIHVGDQLGYYRSLASDGDATSAELASRTGTVERYAREWLEQQAVAGFLAVDDAAKPAHERRFSLPAEYREIFVDQNSLSSMTPAAQILVGTVRPIDAVVEAFRTGGGVPYEDYGVHLAQGQANFNRPMLLNRLAQEYLPAMPDIHARLLSDTPANVADIGMGTGWSSIALAKAYPNIHIDGFDLDALSVQLANDNAAAEGVSDRISFQVRDAGDPTLAGAYDFAIAIECIHDMADPVSALKAMHRLVGPGGTVLIVDERAEEHFAPFGSDMERVFYGFSVLHCLPVGMVDKPSKETGTVMRPSTFRSYAIEAGFQDVSILPVDCDNFNFYRLRA